MARSALVAGPPAANSLKSPSRSPTAASTMVVKALVSVSTFPKNCSVFVVSTVCTAICRSSFLVQLVDRPNQSTNLYTSHSPGVKGGGQLERFREGADTKKRSGSEPLLFANRCL